MKKIIFTLLTAVAVTACGLFTQSGDQLELTDSSTPQEVLDFMMAGNRRFVEGHAEPQHRNLNYVRDLNSGQHPYAAVVACSDSRVPVELLFDEGFGDIFVVRTAGNTILDHLSLGSVDYALNHLEVKVIFFLGHTNCGAITAVTQMGHEHHHINNDEEVGDMVEMIAKTLESHRGTNCNVDAAVKENVLNQTKLYTERPFIKRMIEENRVIIVPAIYDLASGEVQIL
ncbi:MAG: carbonic anhydrase [Rikenellaceae bacterium]